MMMFRLVCFVDDKHLASVMHVLAGKLAQAPTIEPVANATVQGGKVAAISHGSTMSEMFIADCVKRKVKQVRPADVRGFLESVGRSPASCQHVLRQAVEHGALRKRGKGTKAVYEVIGVK